MSKKVQKSVQEYLSKFKKQSQESCTRKWIVAACKHPRALTNSILAKDDRRLGRHNHENENKDVAATLSDIDQFLFENFKSLYSKNERHRSYDDLSSVYTTKDSSTGFMFESPRLDMPPDLCGSSRFFVHPGFSSSLIEEARSSLDPSDTTVRATTTTRAGMRSNDYITSKKYDSEVDKLTTLGDECVAILTYSRNPYDDFRRSMLEMIEARVQHNEKVDWVFMEELLFCYLDLNDEKSSKYILSAFVDIIVVLRQSNQPKVSPVRSSRRGDRIGGGERRKKRVDSIVT